MADDFSPTVIQQPIPIADMTPLEILVLSLIFDADPDGETLYFHTAFGPSDAIGLSIDELRAAFEASAATASTATTYVAERLAAVAADDTEIEIDFSGTSWEFIFQDIVRRSSTLRYVTVVTSFTCSKMRPDGFGGMAVLITAEAITGKSTEDILCDLLDEAEHGPLATAPGFGVHVFLRLGEENVRAEITHLIEADETLTTIAPDAVTDTDIRALCLGVLERLDLTEEQGSAIFKAALAAISQAEQRLAPTG